ncbi:thiamine pyrophosphate-dependent enzyme [Lipingzhangella sp. LS1_29]|uniref:2-oxoisovalerate dehydrogenase subunit alpha n=2 Tax=Lipingzhangella rawalii TaxID=2055835 RepID=A0ABU2H6U8_9ACTN|nr:thiamine pyrophosphate-dependent enzyme [Lipingzhangella rawalii]MDS1271008.1 thiamine pyrophosphate-dependent enzyme [Lipingzhangella rawalii]
MVYARHLDDEAVALQRQGVFPAYVPLRGQEAAQVGSAAAMDRTSDFAFPTYREMAVAVTLGVDMVGYMASHRALWHGGLYDPSRSRLAPINAVVGGPVPHAVGWALGAQLDGTPGCALAYFGDGASSEGDVHEAMNMAAVFQAPVVFLCQNNQWALSVPNRDQVAGGSIAARAAGYGMPGHEVDGNDVLAVYTTTRAALARARSGGGPSLIEARTYRLGPHSTSDDTRRYRSEDTERQWARADPIERLYTAMLAAGTVPGDDSFAAEVREQAQEAAASMRAGVRVAPPPSGEEMFTHVFSEPTDELLRQQRAWREEVELG